MALMAPPQSKVKPQQAPSAPANPNVTPANIGSSEPDQGPLPASVDQSQPQNADPLHTGNPQSDQIIQALNQHLDQLPDQDKAFLAQHLTPEFVRAIGLINGPEVAGFLNQFADQSKVLIPVPRADAAKYLQQLQAQQNQGGQQPQGGGQPQPQPQAAQQQPQPAMMKPQPMPQIPQQPLPNGVIPAPMQHGIMAPRA